MRPFRNVGWNIAIGGGRPPSPKGTCNCVGNLPMHKRRKNYKHSEKTKEKLVAVQDRLRGFNSERMKGKKNPMYGNFGELNPNFVGYYHTPKGIFRSTYAAAQEFNCSRTVISRRCNNPEGVVKSGKLPKYWRGKTWKELGWWFEHKGD